MLGEGREVGGLRFEQDPWQSYWRDRPRVSTAYTLDRCCAKGYSDM